MKFNKNFLTFLTLVIALSPFAATMQSDARALACLNAGGALAPAASQVVDTAAKTATPELAKEATKTLGQWAAQQAGYAKELVVNAPAALEALGIKGLSKLTIDPSKIYLFYRNNPGWLLTTVIGSLSAYIYLKKWTDDQTSLVTGILYNLQYEIDHIKDIHDILSKKGTPSTYTPAKQADSLAKAAKVKSLPLKTDNKIVGLVNEFYTEVTRVLNQAQNSRVADDLQPLQKLQSRIHAHFVRPLPIK